MADVADVASEAFRLAEYGLFPIPLHRPLPGGTGCSCGNESCKPASWGKHPVKKAWAKSVTQDPDILQQDFEGLYRNVGIVIGPAHGIPAEQAVIDIEDDSESGNLLARRLLGDYPAPSYTSGKGTHRLYRWSSQLPPVAKVTVDGLEFRFGGHGKEFQSAAPPSLHASGQEYRWLPGMSLADLPIVPLPQHVIDFILKSYASQHSSGASSSNDHRKFLRPGEIITAPGRHDALLRYANSRWREMLKVYGINGVYEQEVIDAVWTMVHGANLLTCSPPKSREEVEVILKSSQQFMFEQFQKELMDQQNERASAAQQEVPAPEGAEPEDPGTVVTSSDVSFGSWLRAHGIELQYDGKFDFGQESPERIDQFVAPAWSMAFVRGEDVALIQLTLPGIEEPVLMPVADFDAPTPFARAVQTLTSGRYVLNRTFSYWEWKTIWLGRPNGKKSGITRGLKEYLQTRATVIERDDPSVVSQIEEVIIRLAGSRDQLISAVEEWNSTPGVTAHVGRLKVTPTGSFCRYSAPEDPQTGYYRDEDGKIALLVKTMEVSRLFRSSFGTALETRKLTEAMTVLGLEQVKIRRGPLSGRWLKKNSENEFGESVDNDE